MVKTLTFVSSLFISSTLLAKDSGGEYTPSPVKNYIHSYNVGDDAVQITGMTFPIYRDRKITDTVYVSPLSNKQQCYTDYDRVDEKYLGYQLVPVENRPGCVEVKDEAIPEKSTTYCEGQILRGDGRNFKITNVADFCMRFDAYDSNKPGFIPRAYQMLFKRSPVISMQSDDGTQWVTEHALIRRLVDLNTKGTIDTTARCDAQGLFGREKNAIACAIKKSKDNNVQICKELKGTPRLDSFKIESEGWMCYTEMFSEQYCASVSMKCELN